MQKASEEASSFCGLRVSLIEPNNEDWLLPGNSALNIRFTFI